jgi:hypothetical protein
MALLEAGKNSRIAALSLYFFTSNHSIPPSSSLLFYFLMEFSRLCTSDEHQQVYSGLEDLRYGHHLPTSSS